MRTLFFLLILSAAVHAQNVKVMDSSGYHITVTANGSRIIQDTNGRFVTTSVMPPAMGLMGSVAASATTGTISIPMTSRIVTITPTGAVTFNATGGVAGQAVTFAVTTSGTTSFTLTFGTNLKAAGTLATGTTSGKKFSVVFICIDGTLWQEESRTTAM